MSIAVSKKTPDKGQEAYVYLVYCDYCGRIQGVDSESNGPIDVTNREHHTVRGWHKCLHCKKP